MFGMKPKTIAQVLDEDLYAAQREHLKNLGAAEYYGALASMYEQRVSRIKSQIADINKESNNDTTAEREVLHGRVRSEHQFIQPQASSLVHRLATGGAG